MALDEDGVYATRESEPPVAVNVSEGAGETEDCPPWYNAVRIMPVLYTQSYEYRP
jgi:hypothetical protein